MMLKGTKIVLFLFLPFCPKRKVLHFQNVRLPSPVRAARQIIVRLRLAVPVQHCTLHLHALFSPRHQNVLGKSEVRLVLVLYLALPR